MKKATQKDIIKQIAQGHSHSHIKKTLGISTNAFYLHLRRIRRLGVEPTDVNACRRFILGPNAKPIFMAKPHEKLSPLQEKVLCLIATHHTMEQIRDIAGIGMQTLRNTACEAFKRIGIRRIDKPEPLWRAQLICYLESVLEDRKPKPITMDDPFFN